ncbi:MAG: acetyltransferase [Gammaproteobacteria bacterium]|nr:acetyltransferase [Gammaproteobacteria bacterium]MBU1556848.1 acetyltransferase [Gammaproteobacteria bacterium]MBU2071062.1 acetyltransferase [Gammaproteobacteria bacterium]MBU2184330.1 acetyltransferase [Gammaproteobacteria bacterium]MBU2206413.1 acetyltransferase [Gammaproteobacteria bacterium]
MKENPLAKYGVTKPVHRPRIKPVKKLDLDTPEGKLIVLSEAKRIMQIHESTFKRLAYL